jgi:hypothetical protein
LSRAGIHAQLHQLGQQPVPILITGVGVPNIHHSDGLPVYLVAQHARGLFLWLKDGVTGIRLLAYPVAWPGPGEASEQVIVAEHALLKWEVPLPVFGRQSSG